MSARDPPNLRRWVEWALRRPESKVIEESFALAPTSAWPCNLPSNSLAVCLVTFAVECRQFLILTDNFNPLLASACLLDPTLANVLLVPNKAGLLHAAKRCHQLMQTPVRHARHSPPASKEFKCLATKLALSQQIQEHLVTVAAVTQCKGKGSRCATLHNWRNWQTVRKSSYKLLTTLAEDLLGVPALYRGLSPCASYLQ